MGSCLSDERGGRAAVGEAARPSHPSAGGCGGGGAEGATETSEAVEFFYRSRGLYSLSTQLEFSLSASKLRDLDVLSKSDPMAVVYSKKGDGTLAELGRTEVVLNQLDPVWVGKIPVNYHFEIVQPLVFRVFDVDTKFHNVPVKALKLGEQDFLGEATCVLSEIITKQNKSLTLKLEAAGGHRSMQNRGSLTIRAEESVASKRVIEMGLRASHLENKDVFSKSDPFLRISKTVESGGTIPVYKTEVAMNNLNPTWKAVRLTMQQFGSKETPLILECFDFNSNGKHEIMGVLQKSVAELEMLQMGRTGASFQIPSSVRTRSNQMKTLKSQLFVDGFLETTQYTFLDYISNGFELNFMVAVDFTGSNGDPRSPASLHYLDPSGYLNSYQNAILEVGEVIQFYDTDKRFPAWGFGGRLMNREVSHCFNLNGHASDSEVEGVNGIMAAYSSALVNVALAGPTLFGQIIDRAAQIASQSVSHNQPKYFVLLIITDGVVTDLQETINSLVKASDLPLSILIVGVGNADFKQMEILDADNGKRLESSTGRVATRDIVQFVPMREVHSGRISVVQSLLEELPSQFLAYMRCRDIKPHFVN
ncbi:hypothetical protein Sjap_006725 [Stephania japonica]|uniref:Protein BONZAI 3 n=1 Tax=Stephania japonica TaxID=461633 RepID=A0AAP0K8S3_9MAGN